jgi:hypothetical protein
MKPFVTTWTDHRVLSLCLGKAKNGMTLGALAVYVSLSVAEAVAEQLEKVAEPLIFLPTLEDLSGKQAVKDQNNQRPRQDHVAEGQDSRHLGGGGGNEQRDDRIDKNHRNVAAQKKFSQGVRPVSAVHEAIEFVFEFTH